MKEDHLRDHEWPAPFRGVSTSSWWRKWLFQEVILNCRHKHSSFEPWKKKQMVCYRWHHQHLFMQFIELSGWCWNRWHSIRSIILPRSFPASKHFWEEVYLHWLVFLSITFGLSGKKNHKRFKSLKQIFIVKFEIQRLFWWHDDVKLTSLWKNNWIQTVFLADGIN